jgi:hypothetical protein
VANMAFEHNLNFIFEREQDRVNLILYQNDVKERREEFENGGL